ncbi:MAG TPA: hypothetical protein VFJ58_01575 [Armatimonadota bacterium]|nr:hypothetical protein [Armatimonadota bacterium]
MPIIPFPHPVPAPVTPTQTYRLPASFSAAGGPEVFSHTTSAGPDESFFAAGKGFAGTVQLWGPGTARGGASIQPESDILDPDHLIDTVPEYAADGLYVGLVGGAGGWSRPFRLNAPQPRFCGPNRAAPGESVDLIGDELAERPDRVRAWVYVAKPGTAGSWAATEDVSRYRVTFRGPLSPGHYSVWVYAGTGGDYGWGGPVPLDIHAARKPVTLRLKPALSETAIQSAMNRASDAGGGVVELGTGTVWLNRSLIVPSGVQLEGSSEKGTVLAMKSPPDDRLLTAGASGWDRAVGGLEDPGDRLSYRVSAPASGTYSIWVRYGADNSPYNLQDMGGHSVMQVDNGPPVPLMNLPNTGGWGAFLWSRAGSIRMSRGPHTLRWINQKGGGINLDAFALSLDPAWRPGPLASIRPSNRLIVQQAEDITAQHTLRAEFPGGDTAVVWLTGNGCGLKDLTILGAPLTNTGLEIARLRGAAPVESARVEAVRVANVSGKFGENAAIRIVNGRYVDVLGCDLTGRAPFFIQGMSQSRLAHNWLHSVTLYGGNAEAAILGRTHPLHQNEIEDNIVDSPEAAGGPTARRLLWFSTGLGSVTDNYIAGNIGRTRFGGVAGTDQNVGETILFETNMRVAYYGHPTAAGAQSITLPAAGPFTPPSVADGVEAPLNEYYLYVVKGTGLGQARRVVSRRGRTLHLDQPWRVPPDASSIVLEALTFAHNIVVNNQVQDGMSGIQLWIGGYRNIFAGNVIENERREGIYLFGAMSAAGPTMANQWNRGIGPLFYNTASGNQIQQTDQGILVGIGDNTTAAQGADWPRALGTVIRHNTMVRSRAAGLDVSGGSPLPNDPNDLSVEGTIAEFNVVRDAPAAYAADGRTLGTLFRRDHAYFWNEPANPPPKAFSTAGAREVVRAENNVEGRGGE